MGMNIVANAAVDALSILRLRKFNAHSAGVVFMFDACLEKKNFLLMSVGLVYACNEKNYCQITLLGLYACVGP